MQCYWLGEKLQIETGMVITEFILLHLNLIVLIWAQFNGKYIYT